MRRLIVTNGELMTMSCEATDLPFVTMSGVESRNRVLEGRAHWRQLASTVKRIVCGSYHVGLLLGVATRACGLCPNHIGQSCSNKYSTKNS